MHIQSELSSQQQIDEFNQRLADLARHQHQACMLRLADRLQQEVAAQQLPHQQRPPLLSRAYHRLQQWLAASAPQPREPPHDLSNPETVVIIDATYSVVEPAPPPKEQSPWAS